MPRSLALLTSAFLLSPLKIAAQTLRCVEEFDLPAQSILPTPISASFSVRGMLGLIDTALGAAGPAAGGDAARSLLMRVYGNQLSRCKLNWIVVIDGTQSAGVRAQQYLFEGQQLLQAPSRGEAAMGGTLRVERQDFMWITVLTVGLNDTLTAKARTAARRRDPTLRQLVSLVGKLGATGVKDPPAGEQPSSILRRISLGELAAEQVPDRNGTCAPSAKRRAKGALALEYVDGDSTAKIAMALDVRDSQPVSNCVVEIAMHRATLALAMNVDLSISVSPAKGLIGAGRPGGLQSVQLRMTNSTAPKFSADLALGATFRSRDVLNGGARIRQDQSPTFGSYLLFTYNVFSKQRLPYDATSAGVSVGTSLFGTSGLQGPLDEFVAGVSVTTPLARESLSAEGFTLFGGIAFPRLPGSQVLDSSGTPKLIRRPSLIVGVGLEL